MLFTIIYPILGNLNYKLGNRIEIVKLPNFELLGTFSFYFYLPKNPLNRDN